MPIGRRRTLIALIQLTLRIFLLRRVCDPAEYQKEIKPRVKRRSQTAVEQVCVLRAKLCVSPALAGGARVCVNQRPDFDSVR